MLDIDIAPPFDWEELLARCMGRVDLLERLLVDFDNYLMPQVGELEQAVLMQDAAQVRSIAHRIKGAALTVSARSLSKCAERLEANALLPTADPSADCLEEVLRECERLSAAVHAKLQKEPASVSS